ncbi:MAG: CotH kinase family protein, partial [Pirellulales bacterium]
NLMRSPTFVDPVDYQQYYGTVVADPAVDSDLPVMELFFENPEDAETKIPGEGARGALFYDGELYDNVFSNLHGFSTSGLVKGSHDIFFPRDHRFEMIDGAPRLKDVNEITNLVDATLVRQPLAYFIYRQMGTPSLAAFQIRVEQNGAFLGIFDLIEDADDEYLERVGLSPLGALYKMENSLNASGVTVEKKTRTWEGRADLRALVAGLNLEGDARTKFIYDNVNIPAMLNYLVGLVLTAEADCCGRNYFAYRDSEGTGEWQYLPWDVDKSLGGVGTGANRFSFRSGLGNPFAGSGNLLISALFNTPSIRQMYLRRLRSLMDEVLKPIGTPFDERPIEQEILRMVDQMAPDIPLEFDRWGGEGKGNDDRGPLSSFAEQIDFFNQTYWPGRRVSLYGLTGDMNFDGEVDTDDIGPFVTGLAEPAEYEARYGERPSVRGDIDRDRNADLDYDDIAKFVKYRLTGDMDFNGKVDLDDIGPFVMGLAEPAEYEALYWKKPSLRGDTDRDRKADLDFDDVANFVKLLNGVPLFASPIPDGQADALRIEFGDVDANPVSGNQDEEFIELRNPNDVAVDISGWQLTGGIDHTFPPGVVIPAGGSLYVSPNVNAFRARAISPTGGEGRFIQGNYDRHIANAGEVIELRTASGAEVAQIMTPDVSTPEEGNGVASAVGDSPALAAVTDAALQAIVSDMDKDGDIDFDDILAARTSADAGAAAWGTVEKVYV